MSDHSLSAQGSMPLWVVQCRNNTCREQEAFTIKTFSIYNLYNLQKVIILRKFTTQKKDSREKKRKFDLATLRSIFQSVHYPSIYPPSVRPSIHPSFPLPCNIIDHYLCPLRPPGYPRGERVRRRAQLMTRPPCLANDQWLTTNDWKSQRNWCNFLLDKDAHSWTSDCCCVGGRRPVWTMWPVYIIRSAGALSSILEWACPLKAGWGFLLPG